MKQYIFLLLLHFVFSCVSIPREAPALSIELEKQITFLERSHLHLVQKYFSEKRDKIDKFLVDKWIPAFSKNFVQDQNLKEFWKEITAEGNESSYIEAIVFLAPQIQTTIEEQRQLLLGPLDEAEESLTLEIKHAYAITHNINASLYGLLKSASDLEETRSKFIPDSVESKFEDAIAIIEKGFGALDLVENDLEKIKGLEDEIQSNMDSYLLILKQLQNAK